MFQKVANFSYNNKTCLFFVSKIHGGVENKQKIISVSGKLTGNHPNTEKTKNWFLFAYVKSACQTPEVEVQLDGFSQQLRPQKRGTGHHRDTRIGSHLVEKYASNWIVFPRDPGGKKTKVSKPPPKVIFQLHVFFRTKALLSFWELPINSICFFLQKGMLWMLSQTCFQPKSLTTLLSLTGTSS